MSSKTSVVKKNSKKTKIKSKINKEELLKALRLMIQGRLTDKKHLGLIKQGKSFFHIGVSGHEAIQVAIGNNLRQQDWLWIYYRDMVLAFAQGFSLNDYFMSAFGKRFCPSSGGRQMPCHYGHPDINMPAHSSPTGTQFLNAVGTAMASKKAGLDEISYVGAGEGTTSQGEFYEAVNWANKDKLPVLFCIQDNKWAISVKSTEQGSGQGISEMFSSYDNLLVLKIDGTNYLESDEATKKAIKYIRAGKGPVLIHAETVRLLPHSSSDDHRKYREAGELKSEEEQKDPIANLTDYLITNKLSSEKEIEQLWNDVQNDINIAADWAIEQEDPIAEESTKHVYADPETRNLNYSTEEPTEGNESVLVDGINHALAEEMKLNDKILVFGEDIQDPKGGVFTVTKGLTDKFGEERVFNSPLAEASIVGVAVGLAAKGYKPVIEIQFGDYIWPAFQQYKNEVATMRFRSNGGFKAPVVTRVAVGGYIHGGLCHSQNIESIFSHIPGIFIAYPSNSADAKGLLKTACRIEDPVMFLEHKGMYRLPFARRIEPDENYLIEFGKAKTVKTGTDATIITYGMGVKDSVNAVKKYEKETGKSIEIIDLRTIIPWDIDQVLSSVKKTSRALVVHEDTMSGSVSGEIIAHIADDCFRDLDAPVMRLTAKDSSIPYHPILEEDILPNETKIIEKIDKLINF